MIGGDRMSQSDLNVQLLAKRWSKQNIRIACVGLENQTRPDPDMPLRVIGYDGVEYRAELRGIIDRIQSKAGKR